MSQRHKMEKHTDLQCPRCCKLHENLNHVFQCSQAASTCKSAWAQFLSTLQKTSTYPLIVETLGYGISHWSTGSLPQWQGPYPRPTDNFRLLVFTAFQEQQSIGWDQAIRGCLSVHWEKANTLYCQEQLHQGNLTTHSMWSSNLVQGMWQYGVDQWIGRNEFLYEKTKEDQLAKKIEEVDDQIVIMYQTDHQRVRPIDSHFFHMPLARRLEQSLQRKQLWVESVTIAYETWQTMQATHEPNQQQIALFWCKNHGRRPQVRLQSEN